MIDLSTRPVKGPNGATTNWQEWLVDGIKGNFPSMVKRYDPGKLEAAFKVSSLYLRPAALPLSD